LPWFSWNKEWVFHELLPETIQQKSALINGAQKPSFEQGSLLEYCKWLIGAKGRAFRLRRQVLFRLLTMRIARKHGKAFQALIRARQFARIL
jgi:hypothetical protein